MEDSDEVSDLKLKKSIQVYYLIVLAVLILAPTAFFAVFRDHFDTANYENRTLAEAPVPGKTSLDAFPSAFDDWFNDHLPFRNAMLEIKGLADYRVLHCSDGDSVIVGKDGWLFYKGAQANGEDPVGDYEGTNLFTDEELRQIADNMTKARDELKARGSTFYIFLCPNKERMYSEYMPDYYPRYNLGGRLQQVYDYLKANTDLNVVNAYDDLIAFKNEHPTQQLYYKYDTHWNTIGAYVGTKTLTNTLGFGQDSLDDIQIADQGEFTFDLARLMHLTNVLNKDHFYLLSKYTPHVLNMEVSSLGQQIRYTTDGQAPGGKLYIIGDSFSTTSAAYYACHYKEAYLNFYYDYTLASLEEEQPDTVVYETVERYIGNMLHFSITEGIDAAAESQ